MEVKKATIVEVKYKAIKRTMIVPAVVKPVFVKEVVTNIEKEKRRKVRTEAEEFAKSDMVELVYELEESWRGLREANKLQDELELYVESADKKLEWYKGAGNLKETSLFLVHGTSRLFSAACIYQLENLKKIDCKENITNYISEEELVLWQIHMEHTAIKELTVEQLVQDVLYGEEAEVTPMKQLLNRLIEQLLHVSVVDGYEILLGETLGLSHTKSRESKTDGFTTTIDDIMKVFRYVMERTDLKERELLYDGKEKIMGYFVRDSKASIVIKWQKNKVNCAEFALKSVKNVLIDRKI